MMYKREDKGKNNLPNSQRVDQTISCDTYRSIAAQPSELLAPNPQALLYPSAYLPRSSFQQLLVALYLPLYNLDHYASK